MNRCILHQCLEIKLNFCFCFHFQIAETGKRLKMLLLEDVKPVVAQIGECLADWYKRAQTIYLKVSTCFIQYVWILHLGFFINLSIFYCVCRIKFQPKMLSLVTMLCMRFVNKSMEERWKRKWLMWHGYVETPHSIGSNLKVNNIKLIIFVP